LGQSLAGCYCGVLLLPPFTTNCRFRGIQGLVMAWEIVRCVVTAFFYCRYLKVGTTYSPFWRGFDVPTIIQSISTVVVVLFCGLFLFRDCGIVVYVMFCFGECPDRA